MAIGNTYFFFFFQSLSDVQYMYHSVGWIILIIEMNKRQIIFLIYLRLLLNWTAIDSYDETRVQRAATIRLVLTAICNTNIDGPSLMYDYFSV